jgi:hypothetical protein
MTRSTRSIAYLAEVAAGNRAEVLLLRRELIEAMRQNQELAAQAKAYEAECARNKKVLEGIRMTVSLLAFKDSTRTFIESQLDAVMGEK